MDILLNRLIFVGTVLLCVARVQPGFAEHPAIQGAVREYRAAHEREIISEFVRLLSIPNHAFDALGIEQNAQFIVKMLESRGVKVRLLRSGGAPALVYGELLCAANGPTIGIYAHYDGQPVDSAEWRDPPFAPTVGSATGQRIDWLSQSHYDPEFRVYARSASDDKAPIEAIVAALDALRSVSATPSINLKFLFEGEEEVNSPHLSDILRQDPETLQADAWLVSDGPVHQSRRMQVYFGVRGEIDVDMTVYGPARPLHSGHYGNWAPNPIILLTHLIDSMRDTDARILIPRFYDDVRPLTAVERQALKSTPAPDEELKYDLAIENPEGDGALLAEQILKPAINVHGIEAGHVGVKAANIISTEARASFDFRLVPNQTPDKVQSQVEEYLTDQGFFVVHRSPDVATRREHPRVVKLEWRAGYPAYRTSMENPFAQAIVQEIEKASGGPVVKIVSMGAAIPMQVFEGKHGVPVIGVPIANHDNNQHAADENLRLENLWDAIEMYAVIFAELGNDRSGSLGP